MALKSCKCHVRPRTPETHYPSKYTKDGFDWYCQFCRCNIAKIARTRYYQTWLELLESRDLTACQICGYDKCFDNIHYHHPDPSEKELKITDMFRKPITDQRIKELEKTTPMCANCYGEEHYRIRNKEDD